jgi:starch synthase
MYSLRYGTVPLVRHTGGLADTVEPWDATKRTGTGFVFYDFTPEGLAGTIDQALEVWEDRQSWTTLIHNGMAKDFSWEKQSALYIDLYRSMMAA